MTDPRRFDTFQIFPLRIVRWVETSSYMKKQIISGIALGALSISGLYAKEVSMAEAGKKLVMESIEAHGGSEKWYGNGQLQFRWTYHMTDVGPKAIVDTLQTVNTSTLDTVHEVEGKDISFGENGGEYWVKPKDAKFMPPPRFWTHTPIYFFGLPFVFNDENANFEKYADQIEFEGKKYDQVKVSYGEGAGDSPEDLLVLVIDPETKVTRGMIYTVTNKLIAKDGPLPPKFITLDDLKDIDGLKLASKHRMFDMKDGKIGEQVRYTDVSEVKFLPKGTVDLSVQK